MNQTFFDCDFKYKKIKKIIMMYSNNSNKIRTNELINDKRTMINDLKFSVLFAFAFHFIWPKKTKQLKQSNVIWNQRIMKGAFARIYFVDTIVRIGRYWLMAQSRFELKWLSKDSHFRILKALWLWPRGLQWLVLLFTIVGVKVSFETIS